MSELPTIKIFDVDYSFIIKNYLNPELWNKVWTLFQYKDMKTTLNIYSIYTKAEKILFEIKTEYPNRDGQLCYCECDINCSLKIDDISFVKRQINTAIIDTFMSVERRRYVFTSDEYDNMTDMKYDEEERLTKIANSFLENHGITNQDVKEAYISAYVDACSTMQSKIDKYLEDKIYTEMPDMYLTFLSCVTDDPRTEGRIDKIKDKISATQYAKIMQEIEEFKKYMETDEYEKEMQDNLEEV